MANKKQIRFCKFCGESVIYLEDFDDYYCQHCKSYQTKSMPIDIKGKTGEKGKQIVPKIDSAPPPVSPPPLPQTWRKNLPIFRHREYLVVQAVFSWRPRFFFYNVSGQKMGECIGKILSWGGEFDFFDVDGRHIAKIRGNPTITNLQDKSFEVFDHKGSFKGAIKSSYGFLKRSWEIYDARGVLIGRPSESIWLKTHFEMVDARGQVLLSVNKKLWAWRDQFKVIVSPKIDPLLALAFAIAIEYMYWRQSS